MSRSRPRVVDACSRKIVFRYAIRKERRPRAAIAVVLPGAARSRRRFANRRAPRRAVATAGRTREMRRSEFDDRPVFFAPRRRWKKNVGECGGLGVRVGLLQHDELGALQTGAHDRLGSASIGRDSCRQSKPSCIVAAPRNASNNSTAVLARASTEPQSTPHSAAIFGAMLGIGKIAMARTAASPCRRLRVRPSRSAGPVSENGPRPRLPMLARSRDAD
mgnify:CR=1 FL=1